MGCYLDSMGRIFAWDRVDPARLWVPQVGWRAAPQTFASSFGGCEPVTVDRARQLGATFDWRDQPRDPGDTFHGDKGEPGYKALHPGGKPSSPGWGAALTRLDTITRADVEGGRVPGIEYDPTLPAGVAGNAGVSGGPMRLGPGAFDEHGRASSVLIAHEAGHHLVGRIIVDGKVPAELAAFDQGAGRPEGRYGAVAGNVSHLYGQNRQLPEEFIADAYADLLHGRGEFRYVPGVDGPDDPDEREKARAEFEASPTTALLRLIAAAARDAGLPDHGLYGFERDEGAPTGYRLVRRDAQAAADAAYHEWQDYEAKIGEKESGTGTDAGVHAMYEKAAKLRARYEELAAAARAG